MLGISQIEETVNKTVVLDKQLQNDIKLWLSVFDGKAPWNDEFVPSLGLARSICKEIARFVTFESEASIAGNEHDGFLNDQYQKKYKDLYKDVVTLLSASRFVYKPYVRGTRIISKTVKVGCYFPFARNDNDELISVAFASRIVKQLNKKPFYYTLLERHDWEESTQIYKVSYTGYRSEDENELGRKIPLSDVAEWQNIKIDAFEFKKIRRPLFVEVAIDEAIFAGAIEQLKQADIKYGYANWEYEAEQKAVFADYSVMYKTGTKKDKDGNFVKETVVLPKGKDRLFVGMNMRLAEGQNPLVKHGGDIRFEAFYEGLNQEKRLVELNSGISYGTISDPDKVEKRVEEVRAGQRKTVAVVRHIQNVIQEAHEKLIEVMDIYATIYHEQLGIPQVGNYTTSFIWGDSVSEDFAAEYERRQEMVKNGQMKFEVFVAWYHGIRITFDEQGNIEDNAELNRILPLAKIEQQVTESPKEETSVEEIVGESDEEGEN